MTTQQEIEAKNSPALDVDDFFMTRNAFIKKFREEHPMKPDAQDSVDAEINRRIGEVKPEKASVLDGFFAIGAIGTFIADITTDGLVAKQHFQNGDNFWFALTCLFIILPSLLMQLFSCKWFREDYLDQTWWTYLLHLFQLGTIERYLLAFWYGLRTRCIEPVLHSDYIRYLTEWRDITLLRLFEGFLEAAPQMILQLYILTSQKEFIVDRDWLTATSAVMSIISLSWAIVSYSQMLRLCLNSRVLSLCGYCFQICYRLLMVASRVFVLVLFASAFKEYIFVFIFGHCAIMFAWLSCIDAIQYSEDNEERDEPFHEKIFTLIVSVIYLFCFLNIHPSTTKREISIYYSIMFVENAVLMAAWFPYRTLHGVLMYASFGVVFGGFLGGVLCMLLYYKYFHPNQDVTAGWFCCAWLSRRTAESSDFEDPFLENATFSYDDNDKEMVIVSIKEGAHGRSSTPTTPKSGSRHGLSVPVELSRPHSPSKAAKDQIKLTEFQNEEQFTQYGTMQSPCSTKKVKSKAAFSDGALERSRRDQVIECTIGTARSCDPVQVKKNVTERANWKARLSLTRSNNIGSSNDQRRRLESKAELGALKFEGKLPEGDKIIDKNSNSIGTTKQNPLMYRQGSKDDSCVRSELTTRAESHRSRSKSFSAKDYMFPDQAVERKKGVELKERYFDLGNDCVPLIQNGFRIDQAKSSGV